LHNNGREFNNASSRTFFLTHGIHLRMSCPYTSSLSVSSAPSTTWFVPYFLRKYAPFLLGLSVTCRNSPAKHPTHQNASNLHPHLALFGAPPRYDHLRVFGCACYPNLSATAAHKLAPRSMLSTFLGYSPNHKGYRCLDSLTNRDITSRHVVFDETSFPFSHHSYRLGPHDLDFLLDPTDSVLHPISPAHFL
jgi:hypothetical protein